MMMMMMMAVVVAVVVVNVCCHLPLAVILNKKFSDKEHLRSKVTTDAFSGSAC